MKKYGSVRYINIEDDRMLEVKLNNKWLDGRKINANISKFKRKVISLQGKIASGKKLVGERLKLEVRKEMWRSLRLALHKCLDSFR